MYELTRAGLDRKAAQAPADEVPPAAKSLIVRPARFDAQHRKGAEHDTREDEAADTAGTQDGR
ncbi:hypothetical protein [Actinomadura sp. HBU206391]|uniref:hypothetical protein n=1 Tax=Actinomadura sp. HBU206391 TaxID=2731692 RepID=UPI0016500BF5|nr:hypothetical protein [Actinomadura sp. HBU206391]MBC6461201.1 hypothetical protein [Actinomadura sp. HBU206391]